MRRVGALAAGITVFVALLAPSVAGASNVTVRKGLPLGLKYDTVVYTAAAGEPNAVVVRKEEQPSTFDQQLLFTDLGSPLVTSGTTSCVAAAFSAVCAVRFVEAVEVNLLDGDDRADVSDGSTWQVDRVSCGSGFDVVVLGAYDSAAGDCESVSRI